MPPRGVRPGESSRKGGTRKAAAPEPEAEPPAPTMDDDVIEGGMQVRVVPLMIRHSTSHVSVACASSPYPNPPVTAPSSSPRQDDGGADGPTDAEAAAAELPRILFDCTKGESHTPKSGFKSLFRRLRNMYRPEKLESSENFTSSGLSKAGILVLGNPREKFSVTEFEAMKQFVMGGGNLLVFSGEGGEASAGTNINYLLEEFGISVNSDCVVRTVHYKYLHPKEAHISDGILNREIVSLVGKQRKGAGAEDAPPARTIGKDFDGTGLEFVYPYGSTLTVQKPAVPLISTGKIAYPMHRPLGAVWSGRGAGKIVVMGSVHLFDDKWLDKEENSKLMDFTFKLLKPVRAAAAPGTTSLSVCLSVFLPPSLHPPPPSLSPSLPALPTLLLTPPPPPPPPASPPPQNSTVSLNANDADDPDITEFQCLPVSPRPPPPSAAAPNPTCGCSSATPGHHTPAPFCSCRGYCSRSRVLACG